MSTPLATAVAAVDSAQAKARAHMPDGSLGDFPAPAELDALRALAVAAREAVRAASTLNSPEGGSATVDGHLRQRQLLLDAILGSGATRR
jgi:hypothetical protein